MFYENNVQLFRLIMWIILQILTLILNKIVVGRFFFFFVIYKYKNVDRVHKQNVSYKKVTQMRRLAPSARTWGID